MRHNRLLFCSGLYGLSIVLGLGVTYCLTFFATGSKTIATYVIGVTALLAAPLLIVSFYWSYRAGFRAIKMLPEEAASVSRSSLLVAISSSFLIWGILSFTSGSLLTGAVVLSIYAALTGLQVRLLWRAKRQTYQKLIEGTDSSATSSFVIQGERKQWVPILVISVAVQVFGWAVIYMIFQSLTTIGLALCMIAALLCAPLVRKMRELVVERESVP